MLINTLNILTELSLWLLIFGITFSNSATEIFAISIICFFIIRKIALKDHRLPKTPVNLSLYLLCAVILITFFRSAYLSESIRGFLRIIKFTFLFLAVTDFLGCDKKRLTRTFWAMMVIACFTFINGIFQSIFNFDMIRHNQVTLTDKWQRIPGAFVHPNDFAAYIISVLPITFCFLCAHFRKNQRAFLAINCILGSYCLIRTSSRGAWVAFLLGIILYFYFYNKKISIIVPLVIISIVMLLPHGFDRIKGLFVFEQNTVWERTQLWKGTWEMIKAHPFLGFGVNTFSRYFPLYKPPEYWGVMYSHNSYLQMWSEIGILGLGAFLSIVFIVLKQTMRNIRQKIKSGVEGFVLLGALAGYAAFLAQSGLDTNLFSLRLTTLFWVMTAYLVALNKFLEEKPEYAG